MSGKYEMEKSKENARVRVVELTLRTQQDADVAQTRARASPTFTAFENAYVLNVLEMNLRGKRL